MKKIKLTNISMAELIIIKEKLISYGYTCREPFDYNKKSGMISYATPDFMIRDWLNLISGKSGKSDKFLKIRDPKMLKNKRVKQLLLEYLI